MLSNHIQRLLSSTNCHAVELDNNLIGVYNGLSSWGLVIDKHGNTVEKLWADAEIDNKTGETYVPCFTEADFQVYGYLLA